MSNLEVAASCQDQGQISAKVLRWAGSRWQTGKPAWLQRRKLIVEKRLR
jgi:hypothetical protein